jgi:predicted metal-binding membrane protein
MKSVLVASRSAVIALGRGSSTPGWAIIVVALSLAAWFVMLVVMSGMDHGPGTPLHDLPMFLGGWVIMLTAMMLPSELNYIGAFGVLLRGRGTGAVDRQRRVISFIVGYGFAWVAYGLAAYLLDWAARAIDLDMIAWNRAGPYVAGSVLIGAALYQLSPFKHSCLKGCRSPLSFFARYWREGDLGSGEMGFRHGLVCVGCCWALMGVMFAVGVMSLTWMALLTLFMFAEKMLPKGQKLAVPIATFLAVMGLWIALSPETAPLLKDPMVFASLCGGS